MDPVSGIIDIEDMPSIVGHYMRYLVARGAQRSNKLAVPELRRSMERIAVLVRPPRSVNVRPREVDGIPCEWITPKGGEPGAAILYLHGGSFCSGSPVTHRHLAGYISKQANAAVLVPDYRLAPENRFPAALDDCVACYRHLLGLGFAADRIIIAGDSAGGNLVLASLLSLRDNGVELPAAGICLSPVTDLARTGAETRRCDAERAGKDPMIRLESTVPMMKKYVGDHDASEPLLSPLFADLNGLPPLLIQAGGEELLLTDARRFAERARQTGTPVTLQVYAGMWHVWQMFIPYLPEAHRAVASLARFIASNVGRHAEAEWDVSRSGL